MKKTCASCGKDLPRECFGDKTWEYAPKYRRCLECESNWPKSQRRVVPKVRVVFSLPAAPSKKPEALPVQVSKISDGVRYDLQVLGQSFLVEIRRLVHSIVPGSSPQDLEAIQRRVFYMLDILDEIQRDVLVDTQGPEYLGARIADEAQSIKQKAGLRGKELTAEQTSPDLAVLGLRTEGDGFQPDLLYDRLIDPEIPLKLVL